MKTWYCTVARGGDIPLEYIRLTAPGGVFREEKPGETAFTIEGNIILQGTQADTGVPDKTPPSVPGLRITFCAKPTPLTRYTRMIEIKRDGGQLELYEGSSFVSVNEQNIYEGLLKLLLGDQ